MTGTLTQRGLTPARTHLLWELSQRGPSTQRDLADALSVSARNVTGLVDGLESTGWVTREPHPRDRRATLVTLTDKGDATMSTMQEEHREFARLLIGDLSDEEVAGLTRGLAHVLQRLRELIPRGDQP